MVRKITKKKGPGYPTGKPRKYPKTAQDLSPQDLELKEAMQSLRQSQGQPQGHQQSEEPEIDFSAALHGLESPPTPESPQNPKIPLVDNNIYINNRSDISHGVESSEVNRTKVISNNPPKNHKVVKNDKVLLPEIIDDELNEPFDLKSLLTQKELKFLELLFSGNYTQINAMKLAGYIGYHDNSLNRLARKIVQKYEAQVGDHRKIMRAMGYGEVKILKLLIDSATKAKSETVKLNARIALAKCIGVQKEVIEGVEGVTIIFNAPARPPEQPTTTQPGQPKPPPPPAPGPNLRMIK